MSRSQSTERANASVEFAALAAFGVLLVMAGSDLVGYMRSRMRIDTVAGSVANLVTGYQQLYAGDFTVFFQAAQEMAGTVSVTGTDGATIITGVTSPSGAATVAWRKSTGNAGFVSQFGAVGGTATNLPDNYAVPAGSSVVLVEVFTSTHPWVTSARLMGGSGASSLRSAALFQPRASLLSAITAGNRP